MSSNILMQDPYYIYANKPSWTIKCQVKRLFDIHNFEKSNEKGQLLKAILIDEPGKDMQLTLYDKNADKYNIVLKEGCAYKFKHIMAKPVERCYRIASHHLELFATNFMTVEIIDDDSMVKLQHFVPLKNASQKSSNSSDYFDILAVIIYVSKVHTIRMNNKSTTIKRELVLLDERLENNMSARSIAMRILSSSSPAAVTSVLPVARRINISDLEERLEAVGTQAAYYRITSTLNQIHTEYFRCFDACVSWNKKIQHSENELHCESCGHTGTIAIPRYSSLNFTPGLIIAFERVALMSASEGFQ
ncbi:replication protein A 70 kDa DNA-binding subunit A-like [Tasmannia lanceolata]|uniref:replication protein A 70 kDa DNA-binding subunit A-like n=1 Tax=Tasmannia lanceolata TaxID=3420 RepID=UPI00406335D7